MSDLSSLISRYAAGEELSVAERERVERELDGSAEANEMLATEHRLTELLRSAPVPAVNYDLLAARISASIPAAPAAGDGGADGSRMTIGRRPMFSWPRLAMAASVLIAAGVAIPLLNREGGGNGADPGGRTRTTGSPTNTITVRAVDGGASIASTPTGVQNVTVGPSRSLAERPTAIGHADATTQQQQRPSKVVISGDRDPAGSDNPLR